MERRSPSKETKSSYVTGRNKDVASLTTLSQIVGDGGIDQVCENMPT
jgi:hypothetical protein